MQDPSSSAVRAPLDVDAIAVAPSAFRLDGRHVVVTGGGRGLGQGIAVSAARAGARVTVVARTAEQLEQTVELVEQVGGSCFAHAADLSDIPAIPRYVDAIAEVQPVDGVVHAAGVQLRKDAVDLTIEDWRFVQTLNVEAPFFFSTAVAKRQLAEGRAGSHVFIGSITSTIGLPRMAPYVASKTAVLGLARSLSTEWAAAGLRANVIAPGYFRTQLTAGLLSNPVDEARILGRIPIGRLGSIRDLGGVAVFLLSDASAYLSGQLINVDGGWLAS